MALASHANLTSLIQRGGLVVGKKNCNVENINFFA